MRISRRQQAISTELARHLRRITTTGMLVGARELVVPELRQLFAEPAKDNRRYHCKKGD